MIISITRYHRQLLFGILGFLFFGALLNAAHADVPLWDKTWTSASAGNRITYDIASDSVGNTYTIEFNGILFKQGPGSTDTNPLWEKFIGPQTKSLWMNSTQTNVYVLKQGSAFTLWIYIFDTSGNLIDGHMFINGDAFTVYPITILNSAIRDAAGSYYLVGEGSGEVSGWVVAKYPWNGGNYLWVDDDAAAGGQAVDAAVDSAGNIYVVGTDSTWCNLRIKKYTSSGTITANKTYMRSEFAPMSGETCFLYTSTFQGWMDIEIAPSGKIFVNVTGDGTASHRVATIQFDANLNYITHTVLADGTNALDSARRMRIDSSDVIYIGGMSSDSAGNGKSFLAKLNGAAAGLPLLEPMTFTSVTAVGFFGGGGIALGETSTVRYQATQVWNTSAARKDYRMIKYGLNTVPTASNQSVSTPYQTPKAIVVSGADANGCVQSFTFSVAGQPANGLVSPTSGTASCSGGNLSASVTYTPHLEFSGNNSFTFKFNDSIADSNTATISVTVNAVLPTVTSPTATSITTTSAILGANVTSNGGAALTARGTCWGTSSNPTTNCLAEGGTATGIFSHNRAGLPSATTIYYRGHATNAVGTAYSPDSSFVTNSNDTTAPVTSASGTAPPGGSSYSFGSWINQDIGVTLSCADTGGSGCASGYPRYCTDISNVCSPAAVYSSRIDVSTLGTSYTRFFSKDNVGNTETTQSRTLRIDKTISTDPSNLTASAASCSQINLSWTGSTDSGGSGLKEYIIYNASNGAEIARTTSTSYSHTGRSASTAYSYYVKAADNAGNVSGASNIASAATPACGGLSVNPPNGPTEGNTAVTITGTGFSNGTVGLWHMDEGSDTSAADSSGKNNNGTLQNGSTWTSGQFSGAVSLDGANDIINVPANATLNPSGDITITGWFKPAALFNSLSNPTQVLIAKYGVSNGNDNNLLIALVGQDYNKPAAGVPKGTLLFKIENGGGLFACYTTTSQSSWNANQWYHFTAVLSSSNSINKIYINGADATGLRYDTCNNAKNTAYNGDYTIGGGVGDSVQFSGARYFNGTMDEVRIYKRALSQDEISSLITNKEYRTSILPKFDTLDATSVVFKNSTELSALTPAHGAGQVGVSVTNFDGASASCASCYRYDEPAPPPQCSDGIDNDSDGKIDFGAGPGNDSGCTDSSDDSEGSNNVMLSANPILLTATVIGQSSALATSSATFITVTPQAGLPAGTQVTLILDKLSSHAVAQNLVSRFIRLGTIIPEVTLTFTNPLAPQSVVFRLGVPHNTALGTYEPIVIRAKNTDKTTNVKIRAQDPAGNTGER
ncbi:MAG TPA: LamG-like jellyroll fold domain-containing protein [Candidatus Paceibacterota bacterium]